MKKKILVTGDRNWNDVPRVLEVLQDFPSGSILVHGDCRGADLTCAAVGEALGFEVRAYPARWDILGPRAGPMRNQWMLEDEHKEDEPINVCFAFHNDISQSRGTRDMMRRAEKAKIPTILVVSEDKQESE